MKRLLLFLVCSILFLSCSDKKDEPSDEYIDCTVKVTFDNVAVYGGVIYATKEYPLEIESIEFKGNNIKYVAQVEYTVDNNIKTVSYVTPYSYRLNTEKLSLGAHTLTIRFDPVSINYNLFTDRLRFVFTLVESTSDLPGGVELGTYTTKYKMTPDEIIKIY